MIHIYTISLPRQDWHRQIKTYRLYKYVVIPWKHLNWTTKRKRTIFPPSDLSLMAVLYTARQKSYILTWPAGTVSSECARTSRRSWFFVLQSLIFTQIFLFRAKISDSKKSNFTNFNRSIDRCKRKIYTQICFPDFCFLFKRLFPPIIQIKCKTVYVLWCRCANSEQCLQAWFRNLLDHASDIDNFLTTDTCRWIIIDSDISHSIVHSVSRRAGTARHLHCSDCISLNNQLNVAVFTQRRRLIYGQSC